jgi:hypothetical protein
MTVTELLEYMANVYSGCTPEAIKATKASYYAALRKHEGEALQDAWDKVFAEFKATRDNRFPIVKDFTAHLMAAGLLTKSGPKLDLAKHRERRDELLKQWEETQGLMIKNGCGSVIYGHIWLHARDEAARLAWKPDAVDVFVDFSEERVSYMQGQVISQARVAAHGAWALERHDGGAEWARQFDSVMTIVLAGDLPKTLEHQPGQALKPLHVKPKAPPKPANPYEGLD